MNAAECLFRTAVAAGVEVCFANPGTSEMPLVAAIDATPGIRAELCLFEGVCTGAADGYARMTDRPAMTLLHTGPGLANGFANLHNARRADTPIINIIGDQPTWHLPFDPPLASDIEAIARPNSGWVHTSQPGGFVADDFIRAVEASLTPPGQIASLIVPLDCMWEDAAGPVPALPTLPSPAAVDDHIVAAIAEVLRNSPAAILMLGGLALREEGLSAAARIRAATGCRLMSRTAVRRLERGAGLPAIERMPYFPDAAKAVLEGLADLIEVGAKEPVTFFGYQGFASQSAPAECRRHVLARPEDDIVAALEAVADFLGAPKRIELSPPPPLSPANGVITPKSLGAAIAFVQPEGAIVVDEGVSTGRQVFDAAQGAKRHTYICITGGSIGFGIPCATGAAIACPDRPVINLQADGSGLYTVQGLWTQARGGLDVTTVVCANRCYNILELERSRGGFAEFGPTGQSLIDLNNPAVDWVSLSQGFGVPAVSVEDTDTLMRELERAIAEPGPHLIEALM